MLPQLSCSPPQSLKLLKYVDVYTLYILQGVKYSYSFIFRRLDANHITAVPEDSFEGLVQLRHLWLDDNSLTEVPVVPLSNLPSLQALTLALNKITSIPDFAFTNLSSLVVL